MSKILIAYFSASGVTARTAKEMAKAAGADLYEICPAEPYTAADLNWMDQKSRSTLEMNDPACRPAIAAPAADLDQYDTVFVGFPIWWYVEPRIVDTFLERSDFSGKTVIPFATSGGSGIEKAERSLKSHCPQANWKKGKLLNHMDVPPGPKACWIRGAEAPGPQDTGLEQAFPIPGTSGWVRAVDGRPVFYLTQRWETGIMCLNSTGTIGAECVPETHGNKRGNCHAERIRRADERAESGDCQCLCRTL